MVAAGRLAEPGALLTDFAESTLEVGHAAPGPAAAIDALVRGREAVDVSFAAGRAQVCAQVAVGLTYGTVCAAEASARDPAVTVRLALTGGVASPRVAAGRLAAQLLAPSIPRALVVRGAAILALAALVAELARPTIEVHAARGRHHALTRGRHAGSLALGDFPTLEPGTDRVTGRLPRAPAQTEGSPGRADGQAEVVRSFTRRAAVPTRPAGRHAGLTGTDTWIAVGLDGALKIRFAGSPRQRLANAVAVAEGTIATGAVWPAGRQRLTEAARCSTARGVAAIEVVSTGGTTGSGNLVAARSARTIEVLKTGRSRLTPRPPAG